MTGITALVKRIRAGSMVRGTLATAAVSMLVSSGLAAGCTSKKAPVTSIDVPMEYRPRQANLPAYRPPEKPLKLSVAPTSDKRDEPRSIGRNLQLENAIPVYAAGKTPAEFVTEVLKDEMTSAGLDVTSDVENSQRQISSELLKFDVLEDSTYNATVQLKVKVVDAAGKEVYSAIGTGTGNNYGRSKSTENYQQTFSDALRRAISDVLADEKFTAAISSE